MEEISRLESKISEMEAEMDSLKSSRNYYKDQCESLLISLSNTVQKHAPSYRTQEEVEQIIESIKAQQREKRKYQKEQFQSEKDQLLLRINELTSKIQSQEALITQQNEARTTLIEKVMSYKRSYNDAKLKQQETEATLSQIQSINQELSLSIQSQSQTENSESNLIIEQLQNSHAEETSVLKKQIVKLTKKLKQMTNSLQLSQTAQEDNATDINDLSNQLLQEKEKNQQLQEELEVEKKIQIDASSLIKLALVEAEQFQNDAQLYQRQIEELVKGMHQKDDELDRLNTNLVEYIKDLQLSREGLQTANQEIIQLHLTIEQLSQKSNEGLNGYQAEIDTCNQKINELQNQISELNNQLKKERKSKVTLQNDVKNLQQELNQQIRLRKSAELAKETALNNLKNAYALMNTSETTRHETHIEIERLTNELVAESHKLEESNGKIEKLMANINSLNSQIEILKQDNSNLTVQVKQITKENTAMKEHSILKKDANAQIKALIEEKEKLEEHFNLLQTQYLNAISESETSQNTIQYQVEALSKVENEIKLLNRQNRKLRKQLQQAGITLNSSLDMNVDSEIPETCKRCIELEEEIRLLKGQNSHGSGIDKVLEKVIHNSTQIANDFLQQLIKIAESTESQYLHTEIATIKNQIQTNSFSLDKHLEIIIDFCKALIEVILSNKTTLGSNECILLRSSVKNLEAKVIALQSRLSSQKEQITSLKANIENLNLNKQKRESEMGIMNQNISTFRAKLEATQKRLNESEKTNRSLKIELENLKNSRQANVENYSIISHSDSNLSDISSVSSSHSLKNRKKTTMSKITDLNDSLALLDLLCQ